MEVFMPDEQILSNHSFCAGPMKVNLVLGDVLAYPTDMVLCPIDQKGETKSGLFKILQDQQAFEGPPLGSKKWLAMGENICVPVHNLPFPKVILISLFSEALGNANRTVIQQGLTNALGEADKGGAVAVSCPLLGLAKSKLDYGIIAGVMLKGVIDLAAKNPSSLRRILFFTFNEKAFLAFENQFVGFNQG
jgi:hypothetical protein